MLPEAGTGITLGTLALVGGVIVVAGIAYLLYKNMNSKQDAEKSVKKLLDDDDKYNTYKTIIENAIKEKDWQTLEDFLDSKAKKYPNLIKMITEALKQKR